MMYMHGINIIYWQLSIKINNFLAIKCLLYTSEVLKHFYGNVSINEYVIIMAECIGVDHNYIMFHYSLLTCVHNGS